MKRKAVKSAVRQQPTVYFGSASVSRISADATLPAKLGRILEKFNLKKICGTDRVPIKVHVGGGLGYSTIHPVFIRVVVDAVKKAGGKPFLVDGYYDAVSSAAMRGYTPETVGCPIVSAGGPYDSHLITRTLDFDGLEEVNVFGAIWDAPCLINLSHVKGHGCCGYGGACKNIAMGCVNGETRKRIHELGGRIGWIKERCTFCGQCVEACDSGAITLNREKKTVSIFDHHCRFCGHCIRVCPKEALDVRDLDGFRRFQEGMAITTKTVMDSFPADRVMHINLLTDITMLCDCWGLTSPSVVPDIGVMASSDMVAIETASLKSIKAANFIKGSLIGDAKLRAGKHLFEQMHSKDPYIQIDALERHGVGSAKHTLVEVE